MKCERCGHIEEDGMRFCSECDTVFKQINKSDQISSQKSICLVCKGRGFQTKFIYKILSILTVVFVLIPMLVFFGTMEGSTGLFGFICLSSVVLGWGFKKRKCTTCNGAGSITL